MILEAVHGVDTYVAGVFSGVRIESLTEFFKMATTLGNWWFVIGVAIIVVGVCVLLQKQKYIVPFVVTLSVGESITYVTKIAVARARPLGSLVTETDFSFPSGHAMIAVALYGFLVYMGVKHVRTSWKKRALVSLGVLLVLLIGFSRLYLGVHYMSDVVVGYGIGALALLTGVYVFRLKNEH
jgi:undecaprenyl-diphosphatase